MRKVKPAMAMLLILTMPGCTSKENRARALHVQSLEAKKAGDAVKHEELLLKILNDYPSTVIATEAGRELEEIRFNREVLVSNTVEVLRLIMTGQVLFLTAQGRYARSLAELCASKRGGFDPRFLDPQRGYHYEMAAEDG